MSNDRVVTIGGNNSGGIGLAGTLTVLFVALKLLGLIEWSWVWVLSPLWISIILFILMIVFIFGIVWWCEK